MQDCYLFIVAKGKEILGQAESREDALGYIQETYGEDAIKAQNYEPRCQGQLEEWTQGEGDKIRVIMVCKENPSMIKMLEQADVEREVRIPKPMKPVKNVATTPTRTRLVTGKKTPPIPASELPEGTIKRGNDGENWINKKKNGTHRWIRYIEETHDGLERKRKAPNAKAREFKVGTVMTGEDGREWIVKKVKDKNFRWVRYN